MDVQSVLWFRYAFLTQYCESKSGGGRGCLDTQNLGKATKFITPRQMQSMQMELNWV